MSFGKWKSNRHFWTIHGIITSRFTRLFRDPGGSFFLFGPRGTGKSTWLRKTYPKALTIDLLEHDVFRAHAARPEKLREVVRAAPGGLPIVLDEIQKVPELLGVVHALIEEDRARRFIVTESSACHVRCFWKGWSLAGPWADRPRSRFRPPVERSHAALANPVAAFQYCP